MKNPWIRACALMLSSALISPCLADGAQNKQEQAALQQVRDSFKKQGVSPTPKMEEDFLLKFRQVQQLQGEAIQAQVLLRLSRETAGKDLRQTPPNSLPPAAGDAMWTDAMSMTAPALHEALEKHRAHAAPTTFQPREDGFLHNGKVFVDPAGRILAFSGDSITGDVTYFTQQGNGQGLVRFTNVNSPLDPVTVGTIILAANDEVYFKSADGAQLSGSDLQPTSRGVIATRAGALFTHVHAEATRTQTLPGHYQLAPMQRGDVDGTGYALLRRVYSLDERPSPVKLMRDIVGIIRHKQDENDFMLINIHTGHHVVLNRSIGTDKVRKGADCARANAFVNKCRDSISYESLYLPSGVPNYAHYYWCVDWRQTKDGPTAAVMENGVNEVNVIRLDTGIRVNAFKRLLGIQSFDLEPTSDGSLQVSASWMFQNHVIEDVRSLF